MVLPVRMARLFGVMEQVDCGFGNGEYGLWNSNYILNLPFIVFDPKSEIRND